MNNSVVKGVHHVGYMVKDIKKSKDIFAMMGYFLEKEVIYDADRKAEICFLNMGETRIELVSPNKESDIYPLLKKYCNTPYHICYEVNSIDDAINYFKEQGFLVFIDIQRALAISSNAKVVFLMHARLGMIELVEL